MTECDKCRANRIVCQYCIYKDGSPEIDTSNDNIISFNNVKDDNKSKKFCPVCKKVYTDYTAISRKDKTTFICSECGLNEMQEHFEEILREYGIEVIED